MRLSSQWEEKRIWVEDKMPRPEQLLSNLRKGGIEDGLECSGTGRQMSSGTLLISVSLDKYILKCE